MRKKIVLHTVLGLLVSAMMSVTVYARESISDAEVLSVSNGDCEPIVVAEELEIVKNQNVEAPKFDIKGIFGGRMVTLTSATQGATIYYKKDSTQITLDDKKVENGKTITFSNFYGTIYARAYKDGVWSAVNKFVLKIPVVKTPTIQVNGEKVTIKSGTPDSYICYTTDGTKPSWENGKRIPKSGGTITVSAGKTVRAIAVRNCFTNSGEVKAYVPVQPVAFTVKGIVGGRNVKMESATEGAEIYYSTKTGSITTADKKLVNGESIDFSKYYGTVYARAYKNGKWSNVARLILKIPQVATPVITQNGTTVTIETTTPDSTICYTKDGTTPSATNGIMVNSNKAVITINSGGIIKAIAVRNCFSNSEVAEQEVYIYANEVDRVIGEINRYWYTDQAVYWDDSSFSQADKARIAQCIAQNVARDIESYYSSDYEKAYAAAAYVANLCRYTPYTNEDPDYRTAYGILTCKAYTCAGTTRATGLILDYLGIAWQHANENQYTHQWNIIPDMDGKRGWADGMIGEAGYGEHWYNSQ